MAPLRKLPARSALPAKSILKESSKRTSQDSGPLFPTSKKDKRKIKHAQLMSKVTKSKTSKPRRRRPNNKLVTTLDSLANALPDTETGPTAPGSNVHEQVNIIKRKSMKSRPGAMKRREKLDRGERERFAKNMVQMAAVNPAEHVNSHTTAASTTERWAALRGFISQTLEQRPDEQGVKG